MTFPEFMVAFSLWATGMILGHWLGVRFGRCEVRDAAIEAGVGEWAVKNKGPDVEFRWKEAPKP